MQLILAGVEVATEHAGREDNWPQKAGQSRGKHHCTEGVVDSLNVTLSKILMTRTRCDKFPMTAPAGEVGDIRLERGKVVCVQCTQG